MSKTPTRLQAAISRLGAAALSAWEALPPAQQRALRRCHDDDGFVRVRVDTHPATRAALETAKILLPTPRRGVKSRTLSPTGLRIREADPEHR